MSRLFARWLCLLLGHQKWVILEQRDTYKPLVRYQGVGYKCWRCGAEVAL